MKISPYIPGIEIRDIGMFPGSLPSCCGIGSPRRRFVRGDAMETPRTIVTSSRLVVTRLRTRTEPSPLRFSTWRTRPACAFPRPSGRRAPRPPSWWLAGSLCVPPLPHMAGTGQGRCRARSCSGARLAVIILHFPPHPRPPLRSRAHDCLCTPRPLGRCCAPTPPRTSIIPAALDIYSSRYAQNRRAVKGGTIMCGARPRARFGTRVAVR